jgi:hypothetical protein
MERQLEIATPVELVREILTCLGPVGERWPRVLEPTCGKGNFISELVKLDSPPREIQGFELQEGHLLEARWSVASINSPTIVQFHRANIFDLDFRRDLVWRTSGDLLVIGNPPWVTNSELGALESANLPRKSNIKALSGIAARTGSSNFDIAEYILIKLTWRQGVKHDAAAVMELDAEEGRLRNKLGEEVMVEEDYVYPLLKGADLARDGCRCAV